VRSTAAPYTESRLTRSVANERVGFPVVEQSFLRFWILIQRPKLMRIHTDPDLKPNGNTRENTNTKTRLINLPNGSSSAETSRFEGQRYRQPLKNTEHGFFTGTYIVDRWI
jgi:hypothetical protein